MNDPTGLAALIPSRQDNAAISVWTYRGMGDIKGNALGK
jgi:hypothetical protein